MALFSVSYVFQLFQCLFSLSFGTAADTVSACPPPTAPLTIYFQKPAAWPNAKIYYWGETPTGTMPDVTWPGVNMTLMQAGCDWYYFTFPSAVDCSNIIFNSGTGSQTPDLLNRCDDGYYQVGIGWSSTPPSGYCGNPAPTLSVSPSGHTTIKHIYCNYQRI
ncbi:MAG: starch-binding protein [Saprospiraceae bacterium]|nr:starch-binding protein [Saprospiraceae bacterium]